MQMRQKVRLTACVLVASSLIALGAAVGQDRDEAPAFFSGVVLAVDSQPNLLTLEEASAEATEMTFVIDSETRIEKDGQGIELGDISVGDPVSVEYVTRSGENVARSVKLIVLPAT